MPQNKSAFQDDALESASAVDLKEEHLYESVPEAGSLSAERAPPAGGQFPAGVSGNPVGRPKGSKNKVTLLKLMAEEAIRERNYDKAQRVVDKIFDQALEGDKDSQKLVWQSVMSKGNLDDRSHAKEKVVIQIGTMQQQTENPLPKGVIIDNEEESLDGQQTDE